MKNLLNILVLLIFPLGIVLGQNGVAGAQPAKVPGNVKPVTKVKGARESKPTALPTEYKAC